MDYSRADLADRLAVDYVVGTLRGAARRRFEQLLPAHPRLRGAVRIWSERLMPLTGVLAPLAPPAAVWRRIEARLDGGSAAARPATAAASGWWTGLAFWRSLSALAAAAVVGLVVLLSQPGPAQAPVVVVLGAAGPSANAVTPAAFVAGISGDGRAVVTRPLAPLSVQPGRALELWAVPGSGAPRSLGLISAQTDTRVVRRGLLAGTTALAVSLEPPGGSTTGAPSGPILYVGKLAP